MTQEQILTMDLKAIGKALRDPSILADKVTTRLLATRASQLMQEAQDREAELDAQLTRAIPPTTEELAAQATEMAAVPDGTVPASEVVVEVPVVPAAKPYEAEDAELLSVGGIKVVRNPDGTVNHYTCEYQICEEDGVTPIGRPTRLVTRTLAEMYGKQREVHTQATRAFHRLKKQKLSFKQEKSTLLSPEAIAEAARIALEEKDPAKVATVIEATIESKYQTREQELLKKENYETGRAISNEFMRRHLHDYNPCAANKKAMAEYFVENNLEFTLDNLEVAFADLMEQGDKLAVVETPATRHASVVANPTPAATAATPAAPVIPVAETPVTVPASATPQPTVLSQPVAETTVTTPAAAPNVPTPARRPGVNGGLPPGSLSAQRPGTPDPVLARKEFLKTVKDMSPEVMKTKLKNDPQFVKQLRSYGIKIQ
jgi:hypothetical protein